MATLEKSELEIALERLTPEWLAGFFDGEGCITVVRHRYGMPSLIVHLTQCDQNILTLVGMKFGADRRPTMKTRRNPNARESWCLQFGGKSALPVLLVIEPHVILKRKLVQWGIEMAKLHLPAGGNRRWNKGKMEPSIRARREHLLTEIRNENQLGRPHTLQKDKLQ
jgi:hypothetical protein